MGSMVVSQQIDAMRALGTDPVRRLVLPRIFSLVVMLPLLTVACDILGLIGGGVVASNIYNQDYNVFMTSVRVGISTSDLVSGLIKPFFFGLIIGAVACHKGLTTSGGTAGVGRSTTDAVVVGSIWVIIFDFFLSKALQYLLDLGQL
jgi:phospholipid/cholesterol/gamma-HCH transport system permease protein